MSLRKSTIKVAAILVAVASFLYNTNVDVRQTFCLLGSMGYIDFLGSGFLDGLSRCMAETSEYYLDRDFKTGSGSITKVHEIRAFNFSYELLIWLF